MYSFLSALSSLTPDELALLNSIPLLPPPNGTASNFVNPVTRCVEQMSATTVFFAIGWIFLINRAYIKAFLMKTWTWDDVTLGCAAIVGSVDYAFGSYLVLRGLLGRHSWDISIGRFLKPDYAQAVYSFFVAQPLMLGFLKASFFILYLQMFGSVRWAKIVSWAGLALVVVSHVTLAIFSFVVANPHECLSWVSYTTPVGVATASVGLFIDLVIFIVPYVIVSRMRLTLAKKLGAYFLFLTGLSAIMCSVLNIYWRNYIPHSSDQIWDSTDVKIFGQLEVFIGISCACVPALSYGFRQKNSIYQRVFHIKPKEQPQPGATLPTEKPNYDLEFASISSV